jgi:hypothetical protein
MKSVLHLILLTCLVFATALPAYAQPTVKPKRVKAVFPHLAVSTGLGFDLPLADLKPRYGINNRIQMGFHYIKPKRYSIGLDMAYIYGKDVKEDVLAPLRNTEGDLIGINSQLASVQLRERGFFAGATFAYFRSKATDKGIRSLRLGLTPGYMRHWIRLQDDLNSFPQIQGLYKRGYDRMTGGPAAQLSVGFMYQSYSGGINGLLALEANYGQTKDLRTIYYDTNQPAPTAARTDLYLGVRAVWFLPVHSMRPSDEVEY